MDLTLYRLLTQQLPDTPDLSVVQRRLPVPEEWPLVLKSFQTFRKQMKSFTVTDGTHAAICISGLPELYDKVAAMEIGTIVHLIGAETVFNDEHKGYVLDLHDVYTLKEFDDHLKRLQQAEAERMARQQAELGEYCYDGE
jgi:hypothetical protein